MINKYLGLSFAALVFCFGNHLYSQVVSKEGVDYDSRRLSVFEEKQDSGLKDYARARFLLSDRDVPAADPALLRSLGRVLSDFPDEDGGLLLTMLYARHIQEGNPEELFSFVLSADRKRFLSARSLVGASVTLAEFLGREDLAFRLLSDALQRRSWEDSGHFLFPMLFRVMAACFEKGKAVSECEAVLAFLQPDFPEYLTESGHFLLFGNVILQYHSRLLKKGEIFPGHWQAVEERLLNEIWSRREEYVSEEAFYTMLRVLVLAKAHDKLSVYLNQPEIRRQFSDAGAWNRLALFSTIALKQFTRTSQILENVLKKKILSGTVLFAFAQDLLRNGQSGLALKIFEHILPDFSSSGELRLLMARLYYLHNKPLKGVEILMPVTPLPTEGYMILAYLWQKTGNHEKSWQCFVTAEKRLRAGRALKKTDAAFYLSAGLSSHESGHRNHAVEFLQCAYRLDPQNIDICNSLGYILADYGMKLPEAEKLLLYALQESRGENRAILDSVAWLYYRQKRLNEAVGMMIKVLKKQSSSAMEDQEIRQHACEIFRAAGYLKLAEFYCPEKRP